MEAKGAQRLHGGAHKQNQGAKVGMNPEKRAGLKVGEGSKEREGLEEREGSEVRKKQGGRIWRWSWNKCGGGQSAWGGAARHGVARGEGNEHADQSEY